MTQKQQVAQMARKCALYLISQYPHSLGSVNQGLLERDLLLGMPFEELFEVCKAAKEVNDEVLNDNDGEEFAEVRRLLSSLDNLRNKGIEI